MEAFAWPGDHVSPKRRIEIAFEKALKTLDELRREPDAREQEHLVNALCSMAAGHYLQAGIGILRFNRLLGQLPSPVEDSPRSRVTTAKLRQGLTYVTIHHRADRLSGC